MAEEKKKDIKDFIPDDVDQEKWEHALIMAVAACSLVEYCYNMGLNKKALMDCMNDAWTYVSEETTRRAN